MRRPHRNNNGGSGRATRVTRLLRHLFVVLMLAWLCGCSSQAPPPTAAAPDAAAHELPYSPLDVTDDEEDSGTTAALDGGWQHRPPYPWAWREPNPCDGEVTYPPADREFERPTLDAPPEESRGAITAAELRSKIGSRGGGALMADATLQPGPRWPRTLYVEPGEDVTLWYHEATSAGADMEGVVGQLYAFLDYESVPIRLERFSGDRTKLLQRVEGHMLRFDDPNTEEVFTITVPAELLTEQRRYQLSIGHEFYHVGRHAYNGNANVVTIFHGSYDRPPHPCAEPPLGAPIIALEKGPFEFLGLGYNLLPLWVEGETDWKRNTKPFRVRPGQVVRLHTSLVSRLAESDTRPKRVVLQPMLNDQVLQKPWVVAMASDHADFVDARKELQVEMPQQPGVYDVQRLTWWDAFEAQNDLDGERDQRYYDGDVFNGSNVIRFVVEEEEPGQEYDL